MIYLVYNNFDVQIDGIYNGKLLKGMPIYTKQNLFALPINVMQDFAFESIHHVFENMQQMKLNENDFLPPNFILP